MNSELSAQNSITEFLPKNRGWQANLNMAGKNFLIGSWELSLGQWNGAVSNLSRTQPQCHNYEFIMSIHGLCCCRLIAWASVGFMSGPRPWRPVFELIFLQASWWSNFNIQLPCQKCTTTVHTALLGTHPNATLWQHQGATSKIAIGQPLTKAVTNTHIKCKTQKPTCWKSPPFDMFSCR